MVALENRVWEAGEERVGSGREMQNANFCHSLAFKYLKKEQNSKCYLTCIWHLLRHLDCLALMIMNLVLNCFSPS